MTQPPSPEKSEKPMAPPERPAKPAPPERHPDVKPEDADGEFEDLKIRDSENRR